MAGPTEAHRDFFKGMHGNPERAKAFMADPRKALAEAGLDSSVVSEEHQTAITGGMTTGSKTAAEAAGAGVGVAAALSAAAAF